MTTRKRLDFREGIALGLSMVAIVCGASAIALTTPACTKQQAVNAANTTVQVGVDVCDLAPQLIPLTAPGGSVVALLCPLVEGGAKTVEVLIDTAIWNAMVKANEEKKRVDKIH